MIAETKDDRLKTEGMEDIWTKGEDRHFDYVIIGTGPSAMGVLLGLLEAVPSRGAPLSIAMVERGGKEPEQNTVDLKQWYSASHPGRETASVRPIATQMTGRRIDLPTGQGLGGTSNINAGIVMPPVLPDDFETWPEPWKSSLPKSIDNVWRRLEANGMLHKSCHSNVPVLDCNVPVYATLEKMQESASGSQTWKRVTYYDALIAPILDDDKSNCQIEWMMHTEVQRLLFDDGDNPLSDDRGIQRVVGLECCTENQVADENRFTLCHVFGSRAVVLCAGAIESPALLLTSGIGPEWNSNLQGVGRHLQDQWMVPRAKWLVQKLSDRSSLSANGIAALAHLIGKDGRLFQLAMADTVSHNDIMPSSLALAIRRNGRNSLFVMIMESIFRLFRVLLWLIIRFSPLGYILRHYVSLSILFLMHPNSQGHIIVETKQERVLPEFQNGNRTWRRRRDVNVKVDVGYCRDPSDVDAMYDTWMKLDYAAGAEILPGFLMRRRYWFGLDLFALYCQYASQPYYHFSGTCSMKRDEQHWDWVVDPTRLVLRDHNLHICDVSVFPSMISSPPALTCCALGYAFGKDVLAIE